MSISDPTFFDVDCLNRDVKMLVGRVTIGGNGVPTPADPGRDLGLGWTLEGGSGSAGFTQGQYKLTLDKTYTGLVHASFSCFDIVGGGVPVAFEVISEDVDGNKEIRFDSYLASAPAVEDDVPSNSDITFCLYLLDGDVS